MSPPPSDDGFPSNPFAVASILQTAEAREIIAARDIVDGQGTKLWAANLRISPRLHQQLIERKLRHPLETSLRVVDGVSHDTLVREMHRFVDGAEPLASFVMPHAARLTPAVATLPLPPLEQLLLTTAQQLHPGAFKHAVRAMALAGALACALSPQRLPAAHTLRDALHAGLLHDIGEFYLNPDYQSLQRPLLPSEFRHLAAHPQIGALLLRNLAGAPQAVWRAVAEHHERLDGSGYPAQISAAQISPLGQLIAVVEVTLGLASGHAALSSEAARAEAPHFAQRLDFALRFVAGELSHTVCGPLVRWARTLCQSQATPAAPDAQAARALADEMTALGDLLDVVLREADALARHGTPGLVRVAGRARHRLGRLRLAGHAMGLWLPEELSGPAGPDLDPDALVLHRLARRELRHRLQHLHRECLWPETDAALLADERLVRLCQPIEMWLAATQPAAD